MKEDKEDRYVRIAREVSSQAIEEMASILESYDLSHKERLVIMYAAAKVAVLEIKAMLDFLREGGLEKIS